MSSKRSMRTSPLLSFVSTWRTMETYSSNSKTADNKCSSSRDRPPQSTRSNCAIRIDLHRGRSTLNAICCFARSSSKTRWTRRSLDDQRAQPISSVIGATAASTSKCPAHLDHESGKLDVPDAEMLAHVWDLGGIALARSTLLSDHSIPVYPGKGDHEWIG